MYVKVTYPDMSQLFAIDFIKRIDRNDPLVTYHKVVNMVDVVFYIQS